VVEVSKNSKWYHKLTGEVGGWSRKKKLNFSVCRKYLSSEKKRENRLICKFVIVGGRNKKKSEPPHSVYKIHYFFQLYKFYSIFSFLTYVFCLFYRVPFAFLNSLEQNVARNVLRYLLTFSIIFS
jgi:hypothetical protein